MPSCSAESVATTKSGIIKDSRNTVRRQVRHRDGKLLKGGIGLTTGLGWSDRFVHLITWKRASHKSSTARTKMLRQHLRNAFRDLTSVPASPRRLSDQHLPYLPHFGPFLIPSLKAAWCTTGGRRHPHFLQRLGHNVFGRQQAARHLMILPFP